MNFQIDAAVGKLLKNGRDLDDTLTAAVIRNLKIVQVSSFSLFYNYEVLKGRFLISSDPESNS